MINVWILLCDITNMRDTIHKHCLRPLTIATLPFGLRRAVGPLFPPPPVVEVEHGRLEDVLGTGGGRTAEERRGQRQRARVVQRRQAGRVQRSRGRGRAAGVRRQLAGARAGAEQRLRHCNRGDGWSDRGSPALGGNREGVQTKNITGYVKRSDLQHYQL